MYNERSDRPSPMDWPRNYGGEFWDLGLGLNAHISQGLFTGHQLSFEWLQPLVDNVNGYQLERDSALSATWSVTF
jgi:hypothetical protein